MGGLDFQALLDFIVPFFAVTSMAGAGMTSSPRQVIEPMRRPTFFFAVLIANFVLSPLLAYGIGWLLGLDSMYGIGLFLLATAAGSPFLIGLVHGAKADVALATGALVVLVLATIAYMPLALPVVLPWADVRAGAIAGPLLLTMLLPLVVGFLHHAVAPRLAETLGPLLVRLAQGSLVLLVVLMLLQSLPSIINMVGSGALAAGFLFTLATFLVGYALGGRDATQRAVLGLASAQRNVAAAMIVAAEVLSMGTLVMVVVTALVAFSVLFPAVYFLRRRALRSPPRPNPPTLAPPAPLHRPPQRARASPPLRYPKRPEVLSKNTRSAEGDHASSSRS